RCSSAPAPASWRRRLPAASPARRTRSSRGAGCLTRPPGSSRSSPAMSPTGSASDVNGRRPDATAGRKAEHIRINLEADVAAKGVDTGFAEYRFVHQALPELDLEAVDTSTLALGRPLAAPLLVSCMTGGTPEATAINRTLAAVAQSRGLAMGLGSGRALL